MALLWWLRRRVRMRRVVRAGWWLRASRSCGWGQEASGARGLCPPWPTLMTEVRRRPLTSYTARFERFAKNCWCECDLEATFRVSVGDAALVCAAMLAAGNTSVAVESTIDVEGEERGSQGEVFMMYKIGCKVQSHEDDRTVFVSVEARVRFSQMQRVERAMQHYFGFQNRSVFPKAKRLDAMRDRRLVAERRVDELSKWLHDLLKHNRARLLAEALIEFRLVAREVQGPRSPRSPRARSPSPPPTAVSQQSSMLSPVEATDIEVRPRNISHAETLFSSTSDPSMSPLASGPLPAEPGAASAVTMAADIFGGVRRIPKTRKELLQELDTLILGQQVFCAISPHLPRSAETPPLPPVLPPPMAPLPFYGRRRSTRSLTS